MIEGRVISILLNTRRPWLNYWENSRRKSRMFSSLLKTPCFCDLSTRSGISSGVSFATKILMSGRAYLPAAMRLNIWPVQSTSRVSSLSGQKMEQILTKEICTAFRSKTFLSGKTGARKSKLFQHHQERILLKI